MVQESQWALAAWRKSRRSNASQSCVECATAADLVGVRDSHDPTGPMLAFERPAWRRFIDALKHEFLTG